MAFSKSFPTTKDKYPQWEEIFLSDEEEKRLEQEAREINNSLMKECIEDAKKNAPDLDTAKIAVALFEKRASHSVYYKERKCKDMFDKLYPKKFLQ